jgi:bacteriorhodopsin
MSTMQSRRARAKSKALIFGVLSIALYAAVFSFSDTVLHYCARGGFYNVLPVSAVFLFSYVHGTFAGNVWTALGIEGSSASARKAAEKAARTQKPARPRAVAG